MTKQNTYEWLLERLNQTQVEFHLAVEKWIESNYSEETKKIVEFYVEEIQEIKNKIDELFDN